ncbi:MAG: BACON domain-containing protein [Prevotella sp.]|nr:BACON domain-containing protein [Prevotella sp.]
MTKQTLLPIICLISLFLGSCGGDPDGAPSILGIDPTKGKLKLEVSPAAISFEAEGGSQKISIDANQSWTVKGSDSWLSLSAREGVDKADITITADYNNGNERTATITVTGRGETKTVSVSQGKINPELSVTPIEMKFEAVGGTQNLTVKSNTNWTASSNQSWCTIDTNGGNGDGAIVVSVAANTSVDERTATVTVKTGGVQKNVVVTQNGVEITLEVTPTTVSLDANGSAKQLKIMSNGPWTVTSSDTWLKTSSGSGRGEQTVNISAEVNKQTTPRSGKLTIKAGNKTIVVDVTQNGAGVELKTSPATLQFDYAPESVQTVTVTCNEDWRVAVGGGATWCTVKKTTATAFEVSAATNESLSPRTATITVTSTSGNTTTVQVTQKGGNIERDDFGDDKKI